ncbi:hypothetical protein V8G54_006671 [Vigna mungo]|uniref:Translocation and assembly module TamB C-terminal domain-containing protein n=1 Tax=Vigna mungo TaxID=3915 RepID=A0AAQ3P094_VIGMU
MSTSFFGIKLRVSWEGNNTIKRIFPRSKRCTVSMIHGCYPLRQTFRFCGQNVDLLRKHHVSASGWRFRCFKEKEPPFSFSVSYFTPFWKEGFFLVRASVYTAVISGLLLLLWFGRNKAKGFVEANILPSVCSMISECIQHDVCFGKVTKISPLSVTLESCSFGPREDEFSCGEAPTVKVRFRPLSSLWRGNFVFDAVLSHACVMVVQKKDYSWLGIPLYQEGTQRRLSTEEGLDHRTRVRRVAREEAAAKHVKERDDAAREAAEMGYFVSEENCGPSKGDDDLKEIGTHSAEGTNSKGFFCMKEGEQHGHRCVDTGVDYDMKHGDLEKSFRVKFPGKGLKFWSRIIKGHEKQKCKRKAKRSDISASGIALRKRILERGAFAANAYFRSSYGKFEQPSSSSRFFRSTDHDKQLVKSDVDKKAVSVASTDDNRNNNNQNGTQFRDLGICSPSANENINGHSNDLKFSSDLSSKTSESKHELLQSSKDVSEHGNANIRTEKKEELGHHVAQSPIDVSAIQGQRGLVSVKQMSQLATYFEVPFKTLIKKFGITSCLRNIEGLTSFFLSGPIEKFKSEMGLKVEDTVSERIDRVDVQQSEGLNKIIPVTFDSVHVRGATLMLLAYGDREVRVIENVNGHTKFHNHYNSINLKLSGNCKTWRSDDKSEGDGWLSVDVFVDTVEQKWHANLKTDHLFVPLFERILDIPITWSNGRASGEVHLCMSKGEAFPNLYGQLDVTGLNFQVLDAPSCFSSTSGSLCFRGQSIYLHNTSGWFGSIPLEASGDFGIHPEEGEFHLLCQVPSVEVNALMRTFNMRSLLFPLAGSMTALFNCQGPLDTPIFVGTGMLSRTSSSLHVDTPTTEASEVLAKSMEAGALAVFDRVPFSHVSANFTFNTDNCIADLYGIRASLVDGGEIQGAGTVWICSEALDDDTAIDANFSGSLNFEKIMLRYVPSYHHFMPLKFGVLNENTKLSGSLLRPRFDIKWTAPTAEGSLDDARGDIIISHNFITVNFASAAFDLYVKVQTSYADNFSLRREEFNASRAIPFIVGGVDFDLHMHGFELFSLVTPYMLDFPRPLVLKAAGRVKFQGNLLKPSTTVVEQNFDKNKKHLCMLEKGNADSLVGEVSISGLKVNQLMLAPQLSGSLSVSPEYIKDGERRVYKIMDKGRSDESLVVDFVGPLQLSGESGLKSGTVLSVSLHKGQLRANVDFRPCYSASLEVCHFPLDELEIASLRGTIRRAEIQLNLPKRRGHGIISVLCPKFSGVIGEALDVAARWSGDVITIEKTVLKQSHSYYEMQGEYVLPGTRDCPVDIKGDGILERFLPEHVGSVISSMGRWRIKLEVPRAEVAEMLPLARFLSRSMDPAVLSRSKLIRELHVPTNDVLEHLSLPDLLELKGCWYGSLNASGGGNGDTLADFDFHGEDWEWGEYRTQSVSAVGIYSNDDGIHLKKFFVQKDNATIHADGIFLGPKTNLHFAVLNFPVSLIPTLVQIIDSTANNVVHSLRQLLAPIKGILHMEGDLRGSLGKPECDVQIRLLDGVIGGIVLDRAELVASLTPTSRFLFNAKFEPLIQNGHVLIQGSIPVNFFQCKMLQQDVELDNSRDTRVTGWVKNKNIGTTSTNHARDKKNSRQRNEKGWNTLLVENLKGLNWQTLDVREVRVDVDIKDGGMMLVTALTPYADWLHGNADIMLEVRGTVDQPVLNGYASFRRATMSSPLFRNSLTNFGGTVHMKSNRLSITSLESRLGRKGKLLVKGNLPLRTKEAVLDDKIEFKCEVLEVQAKNILSGQVNSQVQITGSILQPNISGNIKLSHGEVYLPHDRGGASTNRFRSYQSALPSRDIDKSFASRYIPRYFGSESASPMAKISQTSGSGNTLHAVGLACSLYHFLIVEKDTEELQIKPNIGICLSDLKLVLGPELKIVYPLILNFAVSGELELNGLAHPKCIKPRGKLVFENGEVDLVATQVRLKREHLNIARFEPDYGLDPMLDLTLVGAERQYRIHRRASNWQDFIEQDTLSPIEVARRLDSQLAESILESNGQLAFDKLATATLEKLMPRIEGKGEFGQAKLKWVYAPQIPTILSGATVDPFTLLADNLTFGTDVEVQLGKRLQARIVRQMKDSQMAMEWTLTYQLTSRLHLCLKHGSSKCILFEYTATSQD